MSLHTGKAFMLSFTAIASALTEEPDEPSLLGSASALERVVTSIGTVTSLAAAGQQAPNSILLIHPDVARLGDLHLEIVLRHAAAARVTGLVVDGSGRAPITTEKLCERLGLALWSRASLDVGQMRSRIDDLVRNPDLIGAGTIRSVAVAMRRTANDLGEIVARLARHLDTAVALFGPDGRAVVGEQLVPVTELAPQLVRRDTATSDFALSGADGQLLLAVPAFPLVADDPKFWLGAMAPRSSELHTSPVAVALRITALALSAHLNQAALTYERSHRGARAMLTDIQRSGARPSSNLVERVAASGWHIFGWHVGVQVRSDGSYSELPEPAVGYLLAEALRRQGIRMPPVVVGRRAELWQTWNTPPTEEQLTDLAAGVARALREVELSSPGVRFRAGIGTAHESPAGVSASLAEARSALAFAEGEPGSAIVRRADQMTAHRLIEHWMPESATREAVLENIEPLVRAEGGDLLIQTLRTYLDLESNAAATAATLNVHRNTVLQRLQKIRQLLPVDLDDPSSRLTIRLALRLQQSRV